MDRDRYEEAERISQASQIHYLAVQVERLADLVDQVIKRLSELETDKVEREAVEEYRKETSKFTDKVKLAFYVAVIGIGAWVLEHVIQSLAAMAARGGGR